MKKKKKKDWSLFFVFVHVFSRASHILYSSSQIFANKKHIHKTERYVFNVSSDECH